MPRGQDAAGDGATGGGDRRGGSPIVVMGVSGSGKSTVGEALAARLEVPFLDADDLHPQANIDKMAAGHPLDDHDRAPWLDAVGAWLAGHEGRCGHPGAVVACSALARRYRDALRSHVPGLPFVLLDGGRELLVRRLRARPGHFMPASLLASQLATLEPLAPDENGLVLDARQHVDVLVRRCLEEYAGGPPSA